MTPKEATQLQKDADLIFAWLMMPLKNERQAYQRICRLTKKYGKKE
jgi:hypothetical protein